MKKQKRPFVLMFILCLALLFSGAQTAFNVFAFSPSIGIGNPGRVDQGTVVSIGFSCNADSSWVFQGTVAVSGGDFRGVSFEQVNGTSIATSSYHAANVPAGGSIQVYVTSDSALTISVSGTFGNIDDPSKGGSRNASITIPVRSTAQRQAEEAAAAQAAQEAAQRQAAANAAAAEEAARQASINESIQAEEAAKAAEQASIAAAESEKASIEESIKEESMSIEASIAYESRMASLEESREARYQEISIAAVEATRAYPIEEMYFVPYGSKSMFAQHFFFAVENSIETIPEGFVRVPLTVNDQAVEAFRTEDMAENVYLVYGRKTEKSEPDFYYYQQDDDSLISFRDVNGVNAGEIPGIYAGLIHDIDTEEKEENSEGTKTSVFPAVFIFYLILSVIIIGLAVFIIYLMKKLRESQENAKENAEAQAAAIKELETQLQNEKAAAPSEAEKNNEGPKSSDSMKKTAGPKRKNRTHGKK